MRWTLIVAAQLSAAVMAGPAAAADKAPPKTAESRPAATQPSAQHAADDKQLRKLADEFVKAYNAGDAKAIGQQFAREAEMVDLDGNVVKGREAIEKFYAEQFEDPLFKVALEIESLRFVGDDLALEDGILIFTSEDEDVTLRSHYTVVHAREAGKWQIVSSRDVIHPHDRVPPHEHLKQLAWLVGDWVEEGRDSLVSSSYRWDESKNFLLGDYAVKVAGKTTMSGTQRIGWDSLTQQIKTWTFDSDGGYGEGYWHRDGERWLVKLTGVAADGRTGSTTQIHTRQNDHTRTWSAVDRVLGGEPLPDVEEIRVVRAAAPPRQSQGKK
jgi:uncharacterized protein (TIGR02246 family)